MMEGWTGAAGAGEEGRVFSGSTLVELFQKAAEARAANPFLWRRDADGYRSMSWDEVRTTVTTLARALREMGVEPGDRVAIVAENRPEWFITDLAVLTVGAVSVPAYTTNTVRDHQFLLEHSEATTVVYSGEQVAKTLLPAVEEVGTIARVIAMEPPAAAGAVPVTSWDDALAIGRQASERPFAEVAADDIACIIYTSGTGGTPKGVMLTHRNMLANVIGAIDLLEELGVDDGEVFLSFLPLSHSYEHTAGQFVPVGIGAQIYYAEGVDTLVQNLTEARPTILTCVPRLYEVMRGRIQAGVKRASPLRRWLFKKTLEIGAKRYEGEPLSVGERLLDVVLERLVRKKVGERFGGRLKAMVSGGAPLNYEVGLFFASLGLPLFQGYGQTEAAPVISANRPKRHKLKSVGLPLKDVEVKIADDGELLVRGPLVMRGYWKDPEATASTLVDGWLHTGDVGSVDDEGFFYITGRKKEMIVNSGGDNISPQRVEGVLTLEPEIGQVLVYGDRRPHLVALVVPDGEFVKSFSRQAGIETEGLSEVADHPDLQKAMGAAFNRANAQLSVIERVRRFRVMSEPFSIENGMMTPTLKLRRPIIVDRFKTELEALYEGKRAA